MSQSRQDALIGQLVSALRKPWTEGYVLKIVDGIPTWAEDSGGGGGAVGPACLIQAAAVQTIPSMTTTAIEFGALVNDSSGGSMWSAAEPTKLVAPTAGHYFAWAAWWYQDINPNIWMEPYLLVDNNDFQHYRPVRVDDGGSAITGATGWADNMSAHMYLEAGASVEAYLYHESGSPEDLTYDPTVLLGSIVNIPGSVDRGALFGMHCIG